MKIKLTQGTFAIIDECMYEKVSKYKWFVNYQHRGGYLYACTKIKVNGIWKSLLLSRFLVGLDFGDKRKCDHKNGNTLDNRMVNLRICTNAQNIQNSKMISTNKSGFKGVSFYKGAKKWVSAMRVNNKNKYIGCFNSKEEAALAYKEASKKLHGQFSRV